MKYLLDTDICVAVLRRHPAALSRLSSVSPEDVGVSAVTLAELYFGAAKSARPAANRTAVEAFLAPLEVLPFDGAAAYAYAPIRLALEKSGRRIAELDLAIAAIARARRLMVITHNTREFQRVEGLAVEDWL